MSLFKIKDYSKPELFKTVRGSGKKEPEENIIKNTRNLFKPKKENKKIKDRIFRDIRALSKQENDYCKPKRVSNFWNNSYFKYESSGNKNKNLSLKGYLDKIKAYFRDIIIILQKSDTWKIQLTIAINFISSKDDDEEHVMHSKSSNIELTSFDNTSEVVKELFEALLSRYQAGLGTSTRESDFIIDLVQLLYYTCHEVNFKRGGSYIYSPDQIKKKKTTIDTKNENDTCFQYAAALKYKEIESHQ